MIRAKAGRNGHHLFQAQSEQRRTREQNKSERDLRDNKSVAKALCGATDRARVRFRLERIRQMASQVEPGDWHCDDDSQENCANETDRREPAIERNVRAEWQSIRAKNFDQPNSPGAHRKAEHSAKEREQNGFNHHLTHDMPTASAHRLADRHFFRAAAGADQKEVHEVDRADEQEEKYAGLHQQQCRTDRANVIPMEWNHQRAKAGLSHHFGLGVVFFDGGILRVDL